MKKQQSKRVIPGFGLTMGVTLAMLSIVVLIPLASLAVYSARLGFREFIQVITRPRVLSGFYVSFITAFAATVVNAIMGLILAWVLVRYDFHGWNDRAAFCAANCSCRYLADITDIRQRTGGKLFCKVRDQDRVYQDRYHGSSDLCGDSFCSPGHSAGAGKTGRFL